MSEILKFLDALDRIYPGQYNTGPAREEYARMYQIEAAAKKIIDVWKWADDIKPGYDWMYAALAAALEAK